MSKDWEAIAKEVLATTSDVLMGAHHGSLDYGNGVVAVFDNAGAAATPADRKAYDTELDTICKEEGAEVLASADNGYSLVALVHYVIVADQSDLQCNEKGRDRRLGNPVTRPGSQN